MKGAKIFLLMFIAFLLCFAFFPVMEYINHPVLLFPLRLIADALAFVIPVPNGDTGMGIGIFVIIIAYYLQMLLIVIVVYWIIKWIVHRCRLKRNAGFPDTKE